MRHDAILLFSHVKHIYLCAAGGGGVANTGARSTLRKNTT